MNKNAAIERRSGIIRSFTFALAIAVACLLTVALASGDDKKPPEKRFRGLLGSDSRKVKTEGGKTYLWAGGDPADADSQWYDFTGSPIPAQELQFGIGKDRIQSIDDPVFVSPDDPRLLKIRFSGYRRHEKPKTNDEIMVIGFVASGEARAYPIALLDRHELVNDRFGDTPVTIGW